MNAGVVGNAFAQTSQQCSTTRQHQAVANNVGSKFWRCSFKSGFNCRNNHADRFIECSTNVFARNHLRTWKPCVYVTTTYVCCEFFGKWPCRPKLQFYFFCSVLTNFKRKFFAEHGHNCIIQFVTCNASRMSSNNSAHGNNCDFGCSSTNVNNQVCTW